jgi:hypothetical protein
MKEITIIKYQCEKCGCIYKHREWAEFCESHNPKKPRNKFGYIKDENGKIHKGKIIDYKLINSQNNVYANFELSMLETVKTKNIEMHYWVGILEESLIIDGCTFDTIGF